MLMTNIFLYKKQKRYKKSWRDSMACPHFFGHGCSHKSTFGGQFVKLSWSHSEFRLDSHVIMIRYNQLSYFIQIIIRSNTLKNTFNKIHIF